MNTEEVKERIERMFLDVAEAYGDTRHFVKQLGGRYLGSPSNPLVDFENYRRLMIDPPRRGYIKIEARPHYDFPPEVAEIPIKRAERMILMGWTP